MSNEEAHVALVRRVFHEGTSVPNPPSVAAQIFASDFICHGPPNVNHSHAAGMIGPEHCLFQGAFSDVTFSIEQISAEADQVKCRFRAHMLQVAEFQGLKPSGQRMSVTGTTTFRVEDSMVKEAWGVLFWD